MPIELTRIEEFALITLNRPEALNALSVQVVKDIGAAIDEAAASDARALLITGAGEKAFCAGADISEFMGRNIVEAMAATELGQNTFAKLDSLSIPSVAVINGYALGGGLELATACTLRVATANARLGVPEIKLGLIPGYGGTQRLPRLVGQGRALDMIMTGRMVAAEEALSMGLINRLVEAPAVDGAIAYAREFAGFSLPVLRYGREAVMRADNTALAEGMLIERDLNTLAFQGEDAKEGANAFLEKRAPAFKDR
ncbi:MAG: enoyl-CoA hydratase-related protein [Alphaproteobacteria bacterium]|jgi:enoyl-CoA hydratase|nr:enoyl-CoA hydratase-related protein [Alphaproteobacteria bacterium]